jgi:hypothetical protein
MITKRSYEKIGDEHSDTIRSTGTDFNDSNMERVWRITSHAVLN